MATKLFRVVTNDNLRVRTSPEVTRSNLIGDRYLVRDDILEVRADSSKEGSGWLWWEHANSPGFWTASQNANGTVILMEEYQSPAIVEIPATTTTSSSTSTTTTEASPTTPSIEQVFEAQTYLRVRSQAKFGNNLIAGEQVQPGSRLKFHNPTKADNYQWWEMVDKPNHWVASGSLAGGQELMLPVDTLEVNPETTFRAVVPWVTQIQSGHNYSNDCGHTCTLMLMRYLGVGWDKGVGDLYALTQFRHARGWTNQVQLKSIAANFGVSLQDFAQTQATNDSMKWLKQIISTKGPVILLVWYPSLGFSNPANGPFNHWVLMTGYSDNTFYMNDPLWTTENKGANRPISQAALLKACQMTSSGTHFVGVYPA